MDANDIIRAGSGKSLNAYKIEDAKESVRIQIERAYTLAEVAKPDAFTYEQVVDEVLGKILRSYGYMTAQELSLVMEAGVAGEFGRQTRPSAGAIFSWIAAYMNSDVRRETIKTVRRNNSRQESRLLTPSEVDELNRAAEVRALNTLWAEFKEHGQLADDHRRGYVAMAMDGAMKRDLFAITPEHWKMAKEDAKDIDRRQKNAWIDRTLFYNPDHLVKWAMLEMCFNGQLSTGRDLVVNS